MPIGARIRGRFERPDPALVAAFADMSACDLADAMGHHNVVDPAIRWVGGGKRSAGTALTVLCRPDDNLMIHAALDRAQPGDVIVVSGGGSTEVALVGELVSAWAAARGVAGFVIDGAIRDVEFLKVPVFARGTSPRAPFRRAAGEVGYAVGLGGVSVAPGDIIVADADGVVVVPRADAERVLAAAKAIADKGRNTLEDIAAGRHDRSFVAKALAELGVEEEN